MEQDLLGTIVTRFEVLVVVVVMKIQVFWHCASCHRALTTLLSVLGPEDEDKALLRNSEICLPVDTTYYLRSSEPSAIGEVLFVCRKATVYIRTSC
jgi:hypothetical protein